MLCHVALQTELACAARHVALQTELACAARTGTAGCTLALARDAHTSAAKLKTCTTLSCMRVQASHAWHTAPCGKNRTLCIHARNHTTDHHPWSPTRTCRLFEQERLHLRLSVLAVRHPTTTNFGGCIIHTCRMQTCWPTMGPVAALSNDTA